MNTELTQQMTLTEHTRLLQWLMYNYPGTHLHTVIHAEEIINTAAEPTVIVQWKDTAIATHWNIMREQ